MNYFITGLPRSRTAWFSEWLPDCLHEGMNGCFSIDEYRGKLVKGDSSSILMYLDLDRYFPDAPIVIVERDIEEIFYSLERINLFNKDVYIMLIDSKKKMDKMNGVRVDFHNLDLKGIWEYLIGTEFDEVRAKRMDNENIQKINFNPDIEAMSSFMRGV